MPCFHDQFEHPRTWKQSGRCERTTQRRSSHMRARSLPSEEPPTDFSLLINGQNCGCTHVALDDIVSASDFVALINRASIDSSLIVVYNRSFAAQLQYIGYHHLGSFIRRIELKKIEERTNITLGISCIWVYYDHDSSEVVLNFRHHQPRQGCNT